MENFNEFIQEAIAGIKRNPHKYPSFCRGMVDKLDRLTAERDRYKTALETIASGTVDKIPPYTYAPREVLQKIAAKALEGK